MCAVFVFYSHPLPHLGFTGIAAMSLGVLSFESLSSALLDLSQICTHNFFFFFAPKDTENTNGSRPVFWALFRAYDMKKKAMFESVLFCKGRNPISVPLHRYNFFDGSLDSSVKERHRKIKASGSFVFS